MASTVLADIAEYHNDVVSSLKLYFSEVSPSFKVRFFGHRPNEIAVELAARLEETDLRSAFAILTRLEATFRIDYERRCREKMKGPLSRDLRAIYKSRKTNVGLDEDIFEAWAQNYTEFQRLIGEVRGAFKFRHWVAHGQYWTPKLGRKYDFNYVYLLAENVLNVLPLCEHT
jgi:hypothetical protein